MKKIMLLAAMVLLLSPLCAYAVDEAVITVTVPSAISVSLNAAAQTVGDTMDASDLIAGSMTLDNSGTLDVSGNASFDLNVKASAVYFDTIADDYLVSKMTVGVGGHTGLALNGTTDVVVLTAHPAGPANSIGMPIVYVLTLDPGIIADTYTTTLTYTVSEN